MRNSIDGKKISHKAKAHEESTISRKVKNTVTITTIKSKSNGVENLSQIAMKSKTRKCPTISSKKGWYIEDIKFAQIYVIMWLLMIENLIGCQLWFSKATGREDGSIQNSHNDGEEESL